MNSWAKSLPLKKLGEIVSGSTPSTNVKEYWDGDIPWITPADLTWHSGIYFQGKLRKITQAGFKSCSTKMLPRGSILFSSRAPIGYSAVTAYPLCTNQGFKSIIPNEKLDPIYGFFALKYFTPMIVSRGRGATFAEINKELFGDFEIPVPLLPEQQRIAIILDKADRIRRLRRYALELGDSYLQSIFLELFGNPMMNPKGWEEGKFGSQINSIRYGTGSPPGTYLGAGIPFIRATNVKGGTIIDNDMVFLSKEDTQGIKKCQVHFGNLIIVRSGINTGDCALIPKKYEGAYAAYDLIVEIDFPKNIFYNVLINSAYGKAIIGPLSRRAGQPHLNADQVKSLLFPLPPPSLQEKFALIVQKFECLQSQQREALRQSEHLFQTLLARTFDGDFERR